MRIMIVGLGYVGLVTGACLASWGYRIIGVDIDKEKLEKLKNKECPIYEPGLEELVQKHYLNWSFHQGISQGLQENPEVIFICVGTPSDKKGDHYLYYVFETAREIAQKAQKELIVISKSTVPVGTTDQIKRALSFNPRVRFHIGSNPETLREGTAISDFLKPDRLIFGVEDEIVKTAFLEIYAPIIDSVSYIITDIKSAEMIKEVSNFFLALRISATNLMAQICEKNGADIKKVMEGVGLDKRIGPHFLQAGLGFGGSCLPKDVQGLLRRAEKEYQVPSQMIKSVLDINQSQRKLFTQKVKDSLMGLLNGRKIAVWGLSFKAETDDVRGSPALDIIPLLLEEGARISAYDSQATVNFKREIESVDFSQDKYEVLKDAQALLILTDWPEFKEIDFGRLRDLMEIPRIIDGRNIFDPATMKKEGIEYICLGRPQRR